MSGGIDSSVSVLLLQQQGYEVEGVTAILRNDLAHLESAKKVAKFLGINHHELSLQQSFQSCVINPFCDDYKNGRTPNPCILCNQTIKFGALRKFATEHDFPYFATGHYCRILQDDNNKYQLHAGVDEKKDQSYFLYRLSEEYFPTLLFPLGGYSKEEVKNIAIQNNVPVKINTESQDICFVESNYVEFLEKECCFTPSDGPIFYKGVEVGTHHGLYRYTIGQRRGTGVNAGHAVFVTGLDIANNALYVGDNEDLISNTFFLQDFFKTVIDFPFDDQIFVRVRYRSTKKKCRIERGPGIKVILEESERGITPGQHAVFYEGDRVVGGGIIVTNAN